MAKQSHRYLLRSRSSSRELNKLLAAAFPVKVRKATRKPRPDKHVNVKIRSMAMEEETSLLSSLNPPPLPFEVLEIILVDAWLSLSTAEPKVRWQFFRDTCRVNHRWHDIMYEVARRHVVVRLLSSADLRAYQAIGRRALQFDTGDPPGWLDDGASGSSHGIRAVESNQQPVDGPLTLSSTTAAGQHPLARAFQRSTIHLHFPSSLPSLSPGRVFSEEDIEQPGPNDHLMAAAIAMSRATPRSAGYLSLLRSAVPDCRQVSISAPKEYVLAGELINTLVKFAASYPSATHLDFAAFFPFSRPVAQPSRLPLLPNIRYLRFQQYPGCSCAKREAGIGHAGEQRCFVSELMEAFPNVEHLHIDTPVILKHITPPPALRTLTLEVAPFGHGQHHSIMGYNLAAALKRGLFSARRRPGEQRLVVLNTTVREPVGWALARAACEEHGIALICRLPNH